MRRRHRAVQRAPRRTRQRHRQAAALLLILLIPGAFIVARRDHHAVTANRNILPGDDIRPADVGLFARRDADVAARRADGAEASALGGAVFTKVVGGFAAAYSEANPAGAHQAGLFGLLKAPGGVGVGGCHDVDVVACRQRHVAVARYRRAFNQQVIPRRHRHVIAAQQGTFLPRRAVFIDGVGGLFTQEPAAGFGFLPVAIVALGGGGEINVPTRRHADIALRRHLCGLRGHVAPGDKGRVAAAGDLRPLLTHGRIDGGFLLRFAAGAFRGGFSQQVQIAPGPDADIPFGRNGRSARVEIVTGQQGEIAPRRQGAALLRNGSGLCCRAVARRTALTLRNLVGGDIDIVTCRHAEATARRHVRPGDVDILPGAHHQPVRGGDGRGDAHIRTT